MSGHTKGPWKIARNGKAGATFKVWRNDPVQEEPFANSGYAYVAGHVNGEANARLIAAAPELLEALKAVVEFWAYGMSLPDGADLTHEDESRVEQLGQLAASAIAKAEGVK